MKLVTPAGTVEVRRRNTSLMQIVPGQVEFLANVNEPRRLQTLRACYMRNPWLFAAVDLLVRGTARIEIRVHAPDENGDSEPIPVGTPRKAGAPSAAQRLVDLMEEPQPGVSWMQWARLMGEDHKVYGNALARIVATPGRIPEEIPFIPWQWVTMETDGDTTLRYIVTPPGTVEPYTLMPREVIHWGRGINARGQWGPGLSRVETLTHTLRLHDVLDRHLEGYFKNSARPSGQFMIQPGTNVKMLEEQVRVIRAQVEEFYAGPENAGKPFVSTGQWQSFSADPKSSSIVELLKHSREEIVSVFHVPPPLVGILDGAIKSNVKELRGQYLRDVVGPDVAELVAELQVQLVNPVDQWRGLRLRPDLDTPLRPDIEARAQVYENMRHVLTPNEMRRAEGLKPLTGVPGKYADTVWQPSGQIPLGLQPPQSQAITYGDLPTDGDGVANLENPEPQPAEPVSTNTEGGADGEADPPAPQ